MRSTSRLIFATMLAALGSTAVAQSAVGVATPAVVTPIPFEGLGLDGFEGDRSIAQELRRWSSAASAGDHWDLGMAVVGPGAAGRAAAPRLAGDPVPVPLKASVKSRVQGLDVQAEMNGDAEAIRSGQARWVGSVGVATEGGGGRAELAVRTSVRHTDTARLIGFEVGPRYERSLPGGLTFFLDGKAEAETAPSPAASVWTPPVSAFDRLGGVGFGSLGVAGRTGIVR